MKKNYCAPEVMITYIDEDIITLSENEPWDGPVIPAGDNGED